MPSLTLIVAATLANGIGQGSRLPWRLPLEMAYFARVTTNAPDGSVNAVVMGRNTWQSIPQKFRPLRRRRNIVISKNTSLMEESFIAQPSEGDDMTSVSAHTSIQDALSSVAVSKDQNMDLLHRFFIIGGASIYKAALELVGNNPDQSIKADRILMTRILSPTFEDCDVFFPEFRDAKAANGVPLWRRASHEEFEAWVGSTVPAGTQREKGVEYEFQMWTRVE